jgi:phosphoglycerol transferase MdoB-like AlkP superfamily enzyme
MVFQKSELFLTMVIVLFFLLTFIFLTLLTVSRFKKIRRLKKQAGYDILAGNFMLSIIFENTSYAELSIEKEYAWVIHDAFFRRCLLDTIIKLHKSYTGEFAKKIEQCYFDSSLIDETYKKLKHGKWPVKCEAVRELAEMNIVSSYSLITQYVGASNLTLRQEAIIAIIKLIGLKGLSFLNDYNELLTDWIQLNLIAIIKNNFPTTDEPYYNSFIHSPNKSVAIFGRRLKSFYEHTDESFRQENELAYIDFKSAESDNPISIFFKRIKKRMREKLLFSFTITLERARVLSTVLFICFFLSHLFEIIANKISITPIIIYTALLNDIYTSGLLTLILIIILTLFACIGRKVMFYASIILYFSIILIHLMLSTYFFRAKVPLGSDLMAYSLEEIVATSKAGGGLSFSLLYIFMILLAIFVLLLSVLNKRSVAIFQKNKLFIAIVIILFIISFLLNKERVNTIDEYENYVVMNKSYFFADNILERYSGSELPFTDDRSYYLASAMDTTEKAIDPAYPFYKHTSMRSTIRPFFKSLTKENKPNLVFILLEGMGSDFMGDHAKMGNFSPFLDSLSKKSLFWENSLSAGGRTFATLPSVFGSLPFLKQGYLEEGEHAPKANSLFRILNCNGYTCQYYTGSSASFDKMDIFLKTQGVEVALDATHFGTGYNKLPSFDGFSWGYGDKDIFKNYFSLPKKTQPTASVFFTVANHSPYLIPDQAVYVDKVKKRILNLKLPEDRKELLSSYLNELSCLLYTDDALRYFFNVYAKRPEYANTIFIITGDHRAPEIPISFQIDRFRVPLIIYSPLLTRTANFKSIVTHLDITPTLLSLLSDAVDAPAFNSWVGTLLDTNRIIAFDRQVALMRNKNEFQDFLSKDYLLSGNNLYQLTNDLGLVAVDNEAKKQQLQEQFTIYKSKNKTVLSTGKLIPDSALTCDFLKAKRTH